MSRLVKHWVAIGLAGLCLGSAAVGQEFFSDPSQVMIEAYIQLVQGDQSLDAHRLGEAQLYYQKARDYYTHLLREFPTYEPRLVQYRKTYCDNQITDMDNRQRVASQPVAPRVPVVSPLREAEPAAPASLFAAAAVGAAAGGAQSVEVEYLQNRIAGLEAELEELDALQEQVDGLAASNRAMTREIEELISRLQSREHDEQETVKGLRAELDMKEQQIQVLQRDVEAKRELDQLLNEMESKVNELHALVEHLEDENNALSDELDDAEIRADQAGLRLQLLEEGPTGAGEAELTLAAEAAAEAAAEEEAEAAAEAAAEAEAEEAAVAADEAAAEEEAEEAAVAGK